MKILIINTVRFRLNGITSVIMNYYRNMDKTDLEIDFVVHNELSAEYRAELESNGSRIFRLPRKKDPLAYMRRLRRLMEDERYDVVHIHGNSAMMLLDAYPAKKAGVPVRIVHSHNTTCSHMTLHKLLCPLFRRTYTHGFACGEEAGKWLYGDAPFVLLKNGIDLRRYRYDEAVRDAYREKLGVGGKRVIGHVGNFIEQKNHAFLLDSFAALLEKAPDCLLLLISDGALLESMQAKAVSLGIADSVIFLGKSTEVAQWMQAIDLFVLPSLHEGLPVVLIEAQAAGLPCIVSDRVSEEADLTDRLTFLPIDDCQTWADEMAQRAECLKNTDRASVCLENQEKIARAGYDVTASANRLRELYIRYVSEEKKNG